MNCKQIDRPNKIRVGVIGVGRFGQYHAQIYSRMSNIELVGVADTDIKACTSVATDCRCQAFTDGNELLGKVDAISIVVPTSLHLSVAQPFIEAGVAILMEKPIAQTYEDSRYLVELAEKHSTVFQVGYLERFNAGVLALAERTVSPRFVDVHRMNTFVARTTDVNVVMDLMIHDIDIVLALISSKLCSVSAVGIPVLTSHVDVAKARLEFENGAVAIITASRVSDKRLRRIRVFTENRYDVLNLVNQQLESFVTVPAHSNGWTWIDSKQLSIKPQKPLDAELAAFIESVQSETKPLVDGGAALKAMTVATQVVEAMFEGSVQKSGNKLQLIAPLKE